MKKSIPILVTALIILSIFLLLSGQTPIIQVLQDLIKRLNGTSTQWNPLIDERLPRLIVLICTGASLAIAGAIMQSLFHNPLASPSVLGISCGGSLLVACVIILEWHFDHPYAIPIAGFTGCLLTLLIVYGLSRYNGSVNIATLLLTGIAISTLLLAVQGALTYAYRDKWQLIQTLTEWESGSTTDRNWKHVHMQLPLTLIGLFGAWYYRREIDILALGDEEALNLGVEVSQVRLRLFLCVALLTGGAIAAVGIIAFFGLVLPHVIRKIYGPNNNQLIPLCIVCGSATMVTMDLFLRTFQIYFFSIGNVSAILGGLFFLVLLRDARTQNIAYRY